MSHMVVSRASNNSIIRHTKISTQAVVFHVSCKSSSCLAAAVSGFLTKKSESGLNFLGVTGWTAAELIVGCQQSWMPTNSKHCKPIPRPEIPPKRDSTQLQQQKARRIFSVDRRCRDAVHYVYRNRCGNSVCVLPQRQLFSPVKML